MRPALLLLALVLAAGCSSPPSPGAEDGDDAARHGRAAASADDLLIAPGTPFEWHGSTASCTGLETPSSCTGQALGGSDPARIGVADGVAAVQVAVSWTAVDEASRVLDVVVRHGTTELARASGESPVTLRVDAPPEAISVEVIVPEPSVARAGPEATQPFDGRAEAFA